MCNCLAADRTKTDKNNEEMSQNYLTLLQTFPSKTKRGEVSKDDMMIGGGGLEWPNKE